MIGALEIIQWDHQLKAIASSVTTSLKSGSPLDEALEHVHFSPTITSYLYLVRNNGDLQSSLEKCITMYEQRLVYMKISGNGTVSNHSAYRLRLPAVLY